jgi:hypothetical protein
MMSPNYIHTHTRAKQSIAHTHLLAYTRGRRRNKTKKKLGSFLFSTPSYHQHTFLFNQRELWFVSLVGGLFGRSCLLRALSIS